MFGPKDQSVIHTRRVHNDVSTEEWVALIGAGSSLADLRTWLNDQGHDPAAIVCSPFDSHIMWHESNQNIQFWVPPEPKPFTFLTTPKDTLAVHYRHGDLGLWHQADVGGVSLWHLKKFAARRGEGWVPLQDKRHLNIWLYGPVIQYWVPVLRDEPPRVIPPPTPRAPQPTSLEQMRERFKSN